MSDDNSFDPGQQDPVDPQASNQPPMQGQGGGQGQDPAQFQQPQPPMGMSQPGGQQAAAGQQGGTPPSGGKVQGGGLSGIMDSNVDVGNLVSNAGQNQQDSAVLLTLPIPPHPNTNFDEKRFVQLLVGSISLTPNEKQKIFQSIPQLSQFQIDELIKIFDEEKGKFAELEKKHSDQIAELEKQHATSPEELKMQQEEENKRTQEIDEAERIKRELGL